MKIAGLQKLTLLDYPEHTACTVFTAGCNFRCPFCHNSDVVYNKTEGVSEEELFEFLASRKGKLDGVCITGGEPLLQPDIVEFMQKIRKLGFLIKLDTNGSMHNKLVAIVNEGLCDYVAMDVKSSPNGYNIACGGMVNVDNVLKSIAFLIAQNKVDYEFRTTVVKQLHSKQDFEEIASLIKGCKRYFLQQYKHSHKVIKEGYSAYSEVEMKELCSFIKGLNINCALRGIDG
ncbi:MAG: anaerobic ribonucleoside-triphosphate reductase activating protein [Clostridiales bacterium]|nr:anaerobic ribonucleoside-triphosphate reductase activating protein [Clostridiales bacterium]